MPDATVPAVSGLLTFGFLSVVTSAVVEVILRAWRPSAEQKDRFGPLLAYIVAIILAVAAALYLNADVFEGVLLGILVGWGAMGVHDTAAAAIPGST